MSKHHDAIKGDRRWKDARAACLERDGHACIWCGATTELEVDHIIELSVDPDLAFDLDNLRTLCRTCHDLRHEDTDQDEHQRLQWINPKYIDIIGAALDRDKQDEVVSLRADTIAS